MSKKNFVSFGDVETLVTEIVDKCGPAKNSAFDPTGTDLESTNVEAAIKELESNFQDGVDAVYDAVVAKGSTPESHSLSDVVDGIAAIQTSSPTQTKSCTPSTSAQTITPDSGYLLSSVSVGAIQTQTKSCTPSTSAQTITPDSGKFLSSVSVEAISTQTKSCTPSTSAQTITPDSGKYLTSVSVGAIPNQRGTSGQAIGNKCWTWNSRVYFGVQYGWYPSGSSFGGMSDVCERYVNYANVASAVGLTAEKLLSGQSCLGINGTGATPTQEKTITASRSKQTVTPDSGKHLSKVTVNKYPDASGTYTYPSGSTGGTYDMGTTNNIRYVNASNVYAKGKADGDVKHSIGIRNLSSDTIGIVLVVDGVEKGAHQISGKATETIATV